MLGLLSRLSSTHPARSFLYFGRRHDEALEGAVTKFMSQNLGFPIFGAAAAAAAAASFVFACTKFSTKF